MKHMTSRSLGLVVLAAAFVFGCGPGDPGLNRRPRSFDFLDAGLDKRLRNAGGADGEWARDYLDGGGTLSEEVNQRRLFATIGKLIHADPAEKVAAFVVAARKNLYDDFFNAFTEDERLRLTVALRRECDPDSVLAERYAAILGGRRGTFPSTIDRMLRSLSLAELAAPAKMPVAQIESIAADSDDPAVLAGASEILNAGLWVIPPSSTSDVVALSQSLMDRAIELSPEDPALRMAAVAIRLRPEVPRAELAKACHEAIAIEPKNGAYAYLLGVALSDAGDDREALAAVEAGLPAAYVSFHGIERARFTVAFLRKAGYGPVGAHLAAYQVAPVHAAYRMKGLWDRILLNGDRVEGAPRLAARFARTLAEQIEQQPRFYTTEVIRLMILLESCKRPDAPTEDVDRAQAIRDRLRQLEVGRNLASGATAWDELYRILGEHAFKRYVAEVLYGDEISFLLECAKLETIEDCADKLAFKPAEGS